MRAHAQVHTHTRTHTHRHTPYLCEELCVSDLLKVLVHDSGEGRGRGGTQAPLPLLLHRSQGGPVLARVLAGLIVVSPYPGLTPGGACLLYTSDAADD